MYTPLAAHLIIANTDETFRKSRYWGRGRQDDVKQDDRADRGARGTGGRAFGRGRGAPVARLRSG